MAKYYAHKPSWRGGPSRGSTSAPPVLEMNRSPSGEFNFSGRSYTPDLNRGGSVPATGRRWGNNPLTPVQQRAANYGRIRNFGMSGNGTALAGLALTALDASMNWSGKDWDEFMNSGNLPAPWDWLDAPDPADFGFSMPAWALPSSPTKAEGQPYLHFVSQFGHTADILLPFDPTGMVVGTNLWFSSLNENFSPLGQLVAGNPLYTPAMWVNNYWLPGGAVSTGDLNNAIANPNRLGWTMLDMGSDSDHFFQIVAYTGQNQHSAWRASVVAAGSPAVSSGTDRLQGTTTSPVYDGLPSVMTRAPSWGQVQAFNIIKQVLGLQARDIPGDDSFLGAEPGGKTIIPPRGPIITIPGEPLPHPPGANVKEKKARVATGLFGMAQTLFHGITEYGDAVDALFDAIPKEKRCKTKSLVGKSWCVYVHLDDVDVGDAIVNLAWNQFEDWAIAKGLFAPNQKAARARGDPYAFRTQNSVNNFGGIDDLGELYGEFSQKYVNPRKDQLKKFLTEKFGI